MKLLKKILVVTMAAAMCFSTAACAKKSGTTKELNTDLKDYDNVINVLCYSKVNADLDKFMLLFGDMESLMASVVTQEVLDDTKSNYTDKCGDDVDYSYEITSEEKSTEEEVAEYQDTVSLFGEKGTIKEAKDLEVKVTATGKDGKYEYEMTVSVGKIDGEWMIVNFNDTLLQ